MTPEAIRRVETLRLELHADRGASALGFVRTRLERLTVAALRGALSASGPDDEADGCWIVDRLAFDLVIDASLPPGALQRGLEDAVQRALRDTLRADRPGVSFLPGRADLLAGFLLRLVRGAAWNDWRDGVFDGLRPLATADAVRTALTADPQRGLAALASLTPADAGRVCEAMSARGAQAMLTALWGDAANIDVGAVARKAAAVTAGVSVASDLSQAALLALVAMRRREERPLAADDVAAAWVAAALVRTVPVDGPAVSAGARRAWIAAARAALAEGRAGHAPVLAVALSALAATADAVAAPERQAQAASEYACAEAGVVLLLPMIHAAVQELADDDETRAWWRLVLLRSCAGRELGERALRQPPLRRLFGLPEGARSAAIPGWLRALSAPAAAAAARHAVGLVRRTGPDAILRSGERALLALTDAADSAGERAAILLAGAVLRAFARRLPGFGRSSARYLISNLLSGGGRIVDADDELLVVLRRPPLGVILAMTGLARGRHAFPWLGSRPLQLQLAS
jgi:hypothetical protein